MSESEKREKLLRPARSGAHDKNSALVELARFIDAEKKRREQSRERPKQPAAEIRHESAHPAERSHSPARERDVGDDSALIDAVRAWASEPRNGHTKSEPREEALDQRAADIQFEDGARRRLLYFTALILVIGVVGLATGSVSWPPVSWPKLWRPAETASIGRESREAKVQPEIMTDASRPAQNAAVVDTRPTERLAPGCGLRVRVGKHPDVRGGIDPSSRNPAERATHRGIRRRQTGRSPLCPGADRGGRASTKAIVRPGAAVKSGPRFRAFVRAFESQPSGKGRRCRERGRCRDSRRHREGGQGRAQAQGINRQMSCQSRRTCSHRPIVPGFLDKAAASKFSSRRETADRLS